MKVKLNKFLLAFIFIFLTAILLRCFLVNWTLQFGNNADLTRYEDWARIAHVHSLADTYTMATRHSANFGSPPNNQNPGIIYIYSGAYEAWILAGKVVTHFTHTAAGSNLSVNTYLQTIFMKIPSFLTDLGMGLFIYLIVARQAGRKKGLLAASLLLFNPVIFYNSAIWGQADSLNNFFFILSLFFALRKNTKLSILAYAASLYIKLSLLPLLPFYLVFLFFVSGKNVKNILAGIILSLGAVILITFPVSANPVSWLVTKLPAIALGEIQTITVAAFNFWWMIFCSPNVGHTHIPGITQTFLGITLSAWGYILFAISTIPLFILQIKKSKTLISTHNIFLLLSLAALLSFMFLPNMHDRYMYPVFPLLAVAVALSKQFKLYFTIFAVLTFLHLSNAVYSWYPIVLDSTSTFYHVFYGDTFGWIVSIVTMLLAIFFYIKTYRQLFFETRQ